jgi:hypothetical protein
MKWFDEKYAELVVEYDNHYHRVTNPDDTVSEIRTDDGDVGVTGSIEHCDAMKHKAILAQAGHALANKITSDKEFFDAYTIEYQHVIDAIINGVVKRLCDNNHEIGLDLAEFPEHEQKRCILHLTKLSEKLLDARIHGVICDGEAAVIEWWSQFIYVFYFTQPRDVESSSRGDYD